MIFEGQKSKQGITGKTKGLVVRKTRSVTICERDFYCKGVKMALLEKKAV